MLFVVFVRRREKFHTKRRQKKEAYETQLTDAIEKKIDEHSPDITVISATSGTVALNANTLYDFRLL